MSNKRIINVLEATWQSIFGVDIANDDHASTLAQDALLKCVPSLITRLADGHWHGMFELNEDIRNIPNKVITDVLGNHATLAEVAYSKYDLVSRGLTNLVGEGLCERRIPEISMDPWAQHKVQVRFFELYGCYEPSMSYQYRFVPAVAQDIDLGELAAWQERWGGQIGDEEERWAEAAEGACEETKKADTLINPECAGLPSIRGTSRLARFDMYRQQP